MDEAFAAVLAEFERRAADEHARFRTPEKWGSAPRDQLLLEVGPETGRLLHALIVGLGARTIVELGTSYGYSTLWLADAARATGGRVISFDVVADKQRYAGDMLARAGLSDRVEFVTGDAVELLPGLDLSVDFALLDIWKNLYIPCLQALFPKLASGGVIAADNMLMPPDVREQADEYRRAVRAKPRIESVLLPIGSGVELSRLATEPPLG